MYKINYNDLDGLNQVVQHDGYKAVRNIIMGLCALLSIKGSGDILAVCLLENYVKSDLCIHGNVYGPAYGKTHLIRVYLCEN